jgi:hypothetical protein
MALGAFSGDSPSFRVDDDGTARFSAELVMDPFRLYLALGPVAIYLLLLGAVNLSRRPLLVSGGRDAAALALAVSGMVVVGPIELFAPLGAAQAGPYVWLLLLALYVLCATLILLLLRPRLVIYNISVDKLRPVLATLVEQLDSDARWAGDGLVLPGLGVQLYVDGFGLFRGASLISAGGHQSHSGWRRLEKALGHALTREEVTRNPGGLTLMVVAMLIVAAILFTIVENPQAAAQPLLDFAASLLKMLGR